jgi:protein-L-isoaspartate(D-aspartate) O-methyltransferase
METPETLAGTSEARAAFLLTLRSSGFRDLDLLRALEIFSRDMFVAAEYSQFAYRNLALPLKCGQVLPEPLLIAKMIEALALERHHRVLEIGTGSGFTTSILAQLAQKIVSIERFKTLASEARARLELLGIKNAEVIHGDGLALTEDSQRYDRIIVHGLLEDCPASLFEHLNENAMLVMALKDTKSATGQSVFRLAGDERQVICGSRLQPVLPGVSLI